MTKTVGASILAAGKGTRLNFDCPKPLLPALGLKLIDYPVLALKNFYKNNGLSGEITAVTGFEKEQVESYLGESYPDIKFALQKEQLGTADALKSYFKGNSNAKDFDYTIVICADTPLISEVEISSLYKEAISKNLDAVVASFEAINPTGYGRIVRSNPGFHIVEEKDASDEIKKITEVNSGFYLIKTKYILENLNNIDTNNKSGEFYLTDLFKDNLNVAPMKFDNESIFMGVNTLAQLSKANFALRKIKNIQLMNEGVYIVDPNHTQIDWNVEIESNVTIHQNCSLYGSTKVSSGTQIMQGCVIENSFIGKNSTIKPYSHIESSKIGNSSSIGPFAHLRPGSEIGDSCKIGNFVETKKSKLENNVSVSHLSYVGDAEVGSNVNIGCGFITCNYDGANKHKTIIGPGSFIGSDTQMIAPINIGKESYIASGSTINKDVPDGAFAIARGKQVTKEDMAKRFIKKK